MKAVKVFLFIVSLLVISRLEAFAQNPYSRSFPLRVGDLYVGELVISFEDMIEVGDFTVNLSATPTSPSRSVFPSQVVPFKLPQLNTPLFLTIETTSEFRGPANVSLRVVLLEYDHRVPLRFFAAQGTPGSQYRDITATAGRGSMYASGYRSGFSEFVLALDKRAAALVIGTKTFELDDALESNASSIEPTRYRTLRSLLNKVIESLLRLVASLLQPVTNLVGNALGVNLDQTLSDLNKFVLSVKEGSARGEIPNTFNDPTNSDGNVAGELFARAKTLEFSLKLLR